MVRLGGVGSRSRLPCGCTGAVVQHEPLTVGSLFSGIGGIDLGLERAGMVTRWFVEWDAHCQNVLRRHWPGVPVYGDITTVDWGTVEPVDVLAGGFPCQPVSAAGKQRAQADARWLWPHFAQAIRHLRPRYVLVENVRNLLAVNGGSAMGEVVGELAALGYDTDWDCIPASAVGAPHERDRLWLVAHTDSQRPAQRGHRPTVAGQGAGRGDLRVGGQGNAEWQEPVRVAGQGAGVPNPILEGLEGYVGSLMALEEYRRQNSDPAGPGWWGSEPALGRVVDGFPHRVDRLRALGNAVVPQVVEWIGRRVVAFDEGREVTEQAA